MMLSRERVEIDDHPVDESAAVLRLRHARSTTHHPVVLLDLCRQRVACHDEHRLSDDGPGQWAGGLVVAGERQGVDAERRLVDRGRAGSSDHVQEPVAVAVIGPVGSSARCRHLRSSCFASTRSQRTSRAAAGSPRGVWSAVGMVLSMLPSSTRAHTSAWDPR